MKADKPIATRSLLVLASAAILVTTHLAWSHAADAQTAPSSGTQSQSPNGPFSSNLHPDPIAPDKTHPLDINTASEQELSALPGLSVDTAKEIVARRPYRAKDDLLRRHIVSDYVYAHITDLITVGHG